MPCVGVLYLPFPLITTPGNEICQHGDIQQHNSAKKRIAEIFRGLQ
uniref:Uncharacterized protein n=1 Tax=Arundo donax TaxID=35708 RepID=A0A0A9FMI7_ARUDO